MCNKEYNGWSNYETWCMNLWLTNEEPIYNLLRMIATSERAMHEKIAALCEFVDTCNPLNDTATVFTDLLNSAIQEVDWEEIITGAMEE